MTFLRRSQQAFQSLRRHLQHVGRVLYKLRAQLIVSVLAFIALSGISEMHQVYRSLVLDRRHGAGDFFGGLLGVAALSVILWYSSLTVLLFVQEWSTAPRSLRAWWRELRVRNLRSAGESPLPRSTAVIVAAISVLPLLGVALGLWFAIPKPPQGQELRFPAEYLRTPDRAAPEKRTELPPGVTLAGRS